MIVDCRIAHNSPSPGGRELEGGGSLSPLPLRERGFYGLLPLRERNFMEGCRDSDISQQSVGMV